MKYSVMLEIFMESLDAITFFLVCWTIFAFVASAVFHIHFWTVFLIGVIIGAVVGFLVFFALVSRDFKK